MFTASALSRAFGVHEATIRNWVQLSAHIRPISSKPGGKRLFDPDEAYAIGLASALLHTAVRISPQVLRTCIDAAFSGQRTGGLIIHETESTITKIDLTVATKTISENLKESKE